MPIWVIVLGAVVVAFLVWLLFIKGDDDNNSGSSAEQAKKTVQLVSAQDLPTQVADVGYPVYWLGPKSGVNYELTLITDGRTYIRYLPKGEPKQSDKPFLTVGSYSQPNAFDVLKDLGKKPGAKTESVPNGGMAVVNQGGDTGGYVAFPGVDTQIEVYDPEPGRALELAKSGALEQVK